MDFPAVACFGVTAGGFVVPLWLPITALLAAVIALLMTVIFISRRFTCYDSLPATFLDFATMKALLPHLLS